MHNFLVKCGLQQWRISIPTFGELVWVKGGFLLTLDYNFRGFATSTLLTRCTTLLRVPADSSASCPLRAHSAPSAVIPKVSKPFKNFQKFYILSLLCLNAWNKPWSPSLHSQVLLRTPCRDNMLCKPSGLWGFEAGRKPTSLVGAVQKNRPAVWIEIMSN